MSDNDILYCLIAFILGYVLCKQMGNGFSVGAHEKCAPRTEKKGCKISFPEWRKAGKNCNKFFSSYGENTGIICEDRMMSDLGHIKSRIHISDQDILDTTGEDYGSLRSTISPCIEKTKNKCNFE